MKLSFAVFAAAVCSAAAKPVAVVNSGLRADSHLGQSLLSKSRRVEDADPNAEAEDEMTWVSGFSLKFQGCHHVKQWNDDEAAEGEENDSRIATKRLVRFRLCPSDSCNPRSTVGCKSGYGDYIIDLNSFMDSYYEVTRRTTEYECETYLNANCDCEESDDKGDDFDRDICEYDCFAAADMVDACSDRNPYEEQDGEQQEQFDAEQYMACQQYEFPQDDDANQRHLEQANEQAWFVGPYCAEQAGAVYLGLFTDDSCTEFADDNSGRTTFQSLAGEELPYSQDSLIGTDCVSCLDMQDDQEGNNNEGNDEGNDAAEQVDRAMEACETMYQSAGKCEDSLPEGTVAYPSDSACSYIEGVKVVRQDGVITGSGNDTSATMIVLLVLFGVATVGMGMYVFKLQKTVDSKQQSLL